MTAWIDGYRRRCDAPFQVSWLFASMHSCKLIGLRFVFVYTKFTLLTSLIPCHSAFHSFPMLISLPLSLAHSLFCFDHPNWTIEIRNPKRCLLNDYIPKSILYWWSHSDIRKVSERRNRISSKKQWRRNKNCCSFIQL